MKNVLDDLLNSMNVSCLLASVGVTSVCVCAGLPNVLNLIRKIYFINIRPQKLFHSLHLDFLDLNCHISDVTSLKTYY